MRRHFAYLGFNAQNRSRGGLTLVEFLVSLFVIVVIFAIALPYIRAAREAARETRCRNQLREIGIAI